MIVYKLIRIIFLFSGIYTCRAIDGFGSVEVNVTLQVIDAKPAKTQHHIPKANMDNLYPPDEDLMASTDTDRRSIILRGSKAPFIIDPPTEAFDRRAGSDVTMRCQAGGVPKPRISWYFKGKPVELNDLPPGSAMNRMLYIRSLLAKHAGVYTCVAENSLGRSNATFDVRVTGEAIPSFVDNVLRNTSVSVGDRLSLKCSIISETELLQVSVSSIVIPAIYVKLNLFLNSG